MIQPAKSRNASKIYKLNAHEAQAVENLRAIRARQELALRVEGFLREASTVYSVARFDGEALNSKSRSVLNVLARAAFMHQVQTVLKRLDPSVVSGCALIERGLSVDHATFLHSVKTHESNTFTDSEKYAEVYEFIREIFNRMTGERWGLAPYAADYLGGRRLRKR
jgi:hypothetical protein